MTAIDINLKRKWDTSNATTSHARTESALDALMKKYGCEPMQWPEEPVEQQVAPRNALSAMGEQDPSWLGRGLRGQISLAETDMLGRVGTRIFAGRIFDEKNSQYDSFTVRGYTGSAGLYQEYRKSESQIYDATQSIVEMGRGVTPVLRPPKHVLRSQQSGVRDWMRQQSIALANFQCLDGGFKRFMEEVHNIAWMGFNICEPGYKRGERGGWLWHRAEPRNQNTVDRWVMVGDELVAVEHRLYTGNYTGGTNAPYGRRGDIARNRAPETHYVLPVFGPRAIDRHVLLTRYSGVGNNWEGEPPTRPSLHWVAFKRLMAQIAAAGAEKFGNPTVLLQKDPEFLKLLTAGYGADIGNVEEAYNAINDQKATDVPAHWLGNGITLKMVQTGQANPQFFDWIEYCDQMISFPFSNEGNLLGMSGAGSYAQAEVKERRMLRTGPAFTSRVEEAINTQIIAPLFFDEFPDAPEAPHLELVTGYQGNQDAWVETVLKSLGPNPPALEDWPTQLRSEFYRRMGIDDPESYIVLTDELTRYVEPEFEDDDVEAGSAEKISDTAFNGAQVTSLVTVVQQVASGMLPAESAIAILKKAFLMTDEEARRVIDPATGFSTTPAPEVTDEI